MFHRTHILRRLSLGWPVVAALALAGLMVLGRSATPSLADDTLVTPEGVTINVYVDNVSAQQVHQWLLAAGLESHTKLARVDVVDTGLTMASVGGGCYPEDYSVQGCWVYDAAIQVTDDNLLAHPNFSLGHEYGHVWENYYRWTYWQGSFDAYLEARGLTGDPRLGSSHCWKPSEILAEDYRTLFGSAEALTIGQCNRDIPLASDVPGLRDFLALTWTNGNAPPDYGGGPAPEPTPEPTSTYTPTPEPTATPVPDTPTATPSESEPDPTATPEPTPTKRTPPGRQKKNDEGETGGNNGNGRGNPNR